MSKTWAEQIAEIDAQLAPIRMRVKADMDECSRLCQARNAILEAQLLEQIDKGITIPMVMALRWPDVHGQAHSKILKWLNDWAPKGLHYGGYRPDTDQIAMELMFDQNKPFEEQLGILEFLPYILPADGHIIGVFEHTLSSHGKYTVHERDDGWELILSVYHMPHSVFKAKDLKEVLQYVYEYHWYRS